MILRMITVVLLLGLLSGCGKHYWEASGRGVEEFKTGRYDPPLSTINALAEALGVPGRSCWSDGT
jgi:hypothetical protein